ncbi:hypothetical protein MCC10007_1505 [Bifidobacterium longum subsp. longum]|nr:hypothetical protein MCC10007_1505 [Bifidobacterium longum subsp. longum]
MLIPSRELNGEPAFPSLSRRVNANSQPFPSGVSVMPKLIKKGEC